MSSERSGYARTYRKNSFHTSHTLRLVKNLNCLLYYPRQRLKFSHFLGGFWHFTADLASKDSAYTSLALGAHNDTTYFSDPAGLQTFHLLSHTEGEGGASLLVDGFKAARILREESPEAYETLCQIKIRGHASGNEKVKLMTDLAYPVLVTAEKQPGIRVLKQIRWNNDDRAAMLARDPNEVTRWYAAAKKWVEILRRPEMEYWEQLRPGRPLSVFQSPLEHFGSETGQY